MQAKQKQNENKFQLVCQKILKVKGGFEMKGTNHITDVTTWLPKGLKSKTVAKVLGRRSILAPGGNNVGFIPWHMGRAEAQLAKADKSPAFSARFPSELRDNPR